MEELQTPALASQKANLKRLRKPVKVPSQDLSQPPAKRHGALIISRSRPDSPEKLESEASEPKQGIKAFLKIIQAGDPVPRPRSQTTVKRKAGQQAQAPD